MSPTDGSDSSRAHASGDGTTDPADHGSPLPDGALPDATRLARPRVFVRPLPRPTKLARARRGRQIVVRTARHFAPVLLHQARRRTLAGLEWARPLRRTFEDLGGTFMKFGQIVGSSPGLFGDDVADEFRSTLDSGTPVPFENVRLVVESELGMTLADGFRSFDPNPIGTASVAVVHRARLHDGREVAVKVLRPGIETKVATDLDLMEPLVAFVARQTGDQTAGSLLQLVDGLREQLGEELDLRNEERAMRHYRELLRLVDLPLICVPETYPEMSSGRVLTMELLDGIPVDDLAAVAAWGVDPAPLVEQIVRAFLLTAIRWGTFHGDVHAGNLLVMRDGRIGVIDWGIVGRLTPDAHAFFRDVIRAALGQPDVWDDVAVHVRRIYGDALVRGLGLDDDALSAFARQILEPILTRPFGEVSLAAILQMPQEQLARARGLDVHDRSIRSTVRLVREQRKMQSLLDAQGVTGSDFDRGTFLLSKQLAYFERYGKMFLADRPLLDDRAFFEALLEESPSTESRPAER